MKKVGIAIIAVILYAFICIHLTLKWNPVAVGECDDYILPVVAIENHFSEFIYSKDLERAKRDFPELAEYLQKTYDNTEGKGIGNTQSPFKNKDGAHKSWYFPTYSFLCIPVKKVLSFLNYPLIYSFALTNILLYICSLLVAFFVVPFNTVSRSILLLLLMVNPVLFYFPWMSAEVCIASFVIISMAFWVGNYNKLAAFTLSIAGTLNPAVMFSGFIMIAKYLKNEFVNWHGLTDEKKRYKVKESLKYFSCYILSVIPFIYNYLYFNTINLTVSNDLRSTDWKMDFWERFIAYLTDWNLGILPYMFLPFVLASLFLVYSIFKKKNGYISLILAFLGTVAIFSVAPNISCGMSGIARYNVWALPILIFALVVFLDEEVNTSVKYVKFICIFVTGVSVLYTGMVLAFYRAWEPGFVPDNRFTPLAKIVLNNLPQIYNPCIWVFHSRTIIQSNLESNMYGEYLDSVDAYSNEKGLIKKILVPTHRIGEARRMFWTKDELSNSFLQQCFNEKSNKKYFYISVPPEYNIYETHESMLKRSTFTLARLSVMGQAEKTDNRIVLYKNSLQFGPYIGLARGRYYVRVFGQSVNGLEPNVTFNNGQGHCNISNIKRQDNALEYYADIENTFGDYYFEGVEFCHKNPSDSMIVITDIKVQYVGNISAGIFD